MTARSLWSIRDSGMCYEASTHHSTNKIPSSSIGNPPVTILRVRLAYRAFSHGSLHFPCTNTLWKAWAPLKCKLFMWLALRHRCWTVDHLQQRGLPNQGGCVFFSTPRRRLITFLLDARLLDIIGRIFFRGLDCAAISRSVIPSWKVYWIVVRTRLEGNEGGHWIPASSLSPRWFGRNTIAECSSRSPQQSTYCHNVSLMSSATGAWQELTTWRRSHAWSSPPTPCIAGRSTPRLVFFLYLSLVRLGWSTPTLFPCNCTLFFILLNGTMRNSFARS